MERQGPKLELVLLFSVGLFGCECVCVCVRACMRACVCVRVCVPVLVLLGISQQSQLEVYT